MAPRKKEEAMDMENDPIAPEVNTDSAVENDPVIKNSAHSAPQNPEVAPSQPQQPSEPLVPLSDVKRLIAEALMERDSAKPMKPKKVTEHHAHVWRFNGKWVVDFKDRNTDPYVKVPIHAFQKFNEQKREMEAWIEVVFHDGDSLELPLNRYVERRVLVYCPILKREKIDRSYSFGEVERKKEDNRSGMLVGSGVMVDQEVTQYVEVFHVRTPEGEELKIPDYAIC